MATFDLTVGGATAHSIGRKMHPTRSRKLTVDTAAVNYSANDILQLFSVPALSLITIVPHVATAEGGVATADLGITEDDNILKTALDLNVATTNAAAAAPFTVFVLTDSKVILTIKDNVNAAIVDFYIRITSL